MKATLIKDNLPYFHGHAACTGWNRRTRAMSLSLPRRPTPFTQGQRPTFSRQMPMDWSLAGTRLMGLIEAALAMQ